MLAQTRQRLTEREATLNAILEPGVQLFQLTASGDPEPGIQLFWNRAASIAPSSTATGSSRCRREGVPALVHQGREAGAFGHLQARAGRPRQRGDGSRCRDGTVSAAAMTVEPEAGSAPADLAHRDGGNAAEVLSLDVYQRATMAARAHGGAGAPGGRRAVRRLRRRNPDARDIAAERAEYVAWLTTAPTSPLAAIAQQPIGTGLRARPVRRRHAARRASPSSA